jgi:hypothetical protein
MIDTELRHMFAERESGVPAAGPVAHRIAAGVRRRGRRTRTVRAVSVALAAVLAAVAVPVAVSQWHRAAVTGPGGSAPPIPTGPSATRTDGVLETAGCATYPTAHPTQIDGTPQVGNSDPINEISQRLIPYATDHFGSVYAGTEIQTEIGVLRVYRKRDGLGERRHGVVIVPSAAFDAWIMQEFATTCVEIADARVSLEEISAAVDQVMNDHAYWLSRGIEIFTAGGDPVKGIVEVGVAKAAVAKARREMPARYPGLTIRIIEGHPATL